MYKHITVESSSFWTFHLFYYFTFYPKNGKNYGKKHVFLDIFPYIQCILTYVHGFFFLKYATWTVQVNEVFHSCTLQANACKQPPHTKKRSIFSKFCLIFQKKCRQCLPALPAKNVLLPAQSRSLSRKKNRAYVS